GLRGSGKKPERRFNTAADFLRALRRARGREPGAVSSEESDATAALDGKGTGVIGETTDELLRDPYHTQPIVTEVCPVCGEEVEHGEGVCRRCGHDLTSSPATSELARKEVTARQDRRGLMLFAFTAGLLVLLASLVYLVRRQGSGVPTAGEKVSRPATAVTPPAAATPAPTPAPGESVGRAAFEFEPLDAESLRVCQAAQAGPPNRPFVMWVREVQAFGTYDGQGDK